MTLIYYSRRKELEKTYGHNFNRSSFQHPIYMFLIGGYALLTLGFVTTGLIIGSGGGH
jgi:hypothetical protein